MLQRVQTLYFLSALILVVVFLFSPFAYAPLVDDESSTSTLMEMLPVNFVALYIPVYITIALIIASVFTFKNYGLQKKLSLLSILGILYCEGVVLYAVLSPIYEMSTSVTIATIWSWGGILLLVAAVAMWMGYRKVCADDKLIRSYDRLR